MKITLDPFDHSYSDFVVFNGLKPTYKNKQLLCAKGHTFFVTLATFFLTFLLIIPPNKKNNNKGYFRTFERIFVKKEGFWGSKKFLGGEGGGTVQWGLSVIKGYFKGYRGEIW